MKNIIFFDIDGTFVSEIDAKPVESTIKAYNTLVTNGHDVYLCTGRNKRDAEKIAYEYGIDSFICSNGQYIQKQGGEYFTRYLSKSEKDLYSSELEKKGVTYGYMSNNGVFILEHTKGDEEKAFDAPWMKYAYASTEQFYLDDVTCLIIIDDDAEHYPVIKANNNMYFWSGTHFQVVPNDINKGIAIQEVLKSYQQDICVYAFGDEDNDIQMFEKADIAIAMGNAKAQVKQAANFVTSKSSEGGIEKALRKYNLI